MPPSSNWLKVAPTTKGAKPPQPSNQDRACALNSTSSRNTAAALESPPRPRELGAMQFSISNFQFSMPPPSSHESSPRSLRAESPQCDSLGCSKAEPQVTDHTDISSPERAKRGNLVSLTSM